MGAGEWGNGCGEGSWMLVVLIFESCVVDFLCPKDAIAITQAVIHIQRALRP